MSKRSEHFQLPLKNITASFNSISMAYSTDSGLYNLTNSPMSSLAINLSELSTGRKTPKLRRRLSLSSVDTPPNDCGKNDQESSHSAESGCFSESPFDDSPTLESLSVKRYTAALHPEIPLEAFSVKKKTIAFRRISSQPLPAMRLDSPTDFLEEDRGELDDDDYGRTENRQEYESDDTLSNENFHGYKRNKLFSDDATSQDSGLGLENDPLSQRSSVSSFEDASSTSLSMSQLNRLPSLEDVWNSMDSPSFKAPKGMPPKRFRSLIDEKQYSEDTCSPIKYSPVKPSSIPRPSFSKALFCQVPESANEASEGNKNTADDGFQELFKLNDLDNEVDAKVSSLINATLLHRVCEDKPDKFSAEEMQRTSKNDTPSGRPTAERRSLYRSHSLNIRSRQSCKRYEAPSEGLTPVQCKRWKGEDISMNVSHDSTIGTGDKKNCVRRLQRCNSETEAIKSAVSRMVSEPDLIGDCSKACCLPTVSGKHQDLKSITPETLSRLMADEFSDIVEEFHIIDCRYPYEYDGGHIQNALNIYTKEDVIEKYMKSPLRVKDASKRIILVFHCEFSSERGPGLFRFLRRQDRETNKDYYPYLHYPELYLLEGGYKSFFESYSHLCEPRNYKTMFDKNHTDDLRKFRIKSKSWQDEKSQARSGVRNLKF